MMDTDCDGPLGARGRTTARDGLAQIMHMVHDGDPPHPRAEAAAAPLSPIHPGARGKVTTNMMSTYLLSCQCKTSFRFMSLTPGTPNSTEGLITVEQAALGFVGIEGHVCAWMVRASLHRASA